MPYKDPIRAKQYRKEYYKKIKEKKIAYNKKWAKQNKEKVSQYKEKYLKNNPEKRKESWSKYNKSIEGMKKKHEWYRNWANNLGVKTWEEWVKHRKDHAINPASSYPSEFNKELKAIVLKRDKYQCQGCMMIQPLSKVLYKRGLAVHHIDYDKNNCSLDNLTTLCVSCNTKANRLRSYWEIFYKRKKPKVAVVIPSIRKETIETMLRVWEKELSETTIIVVEDHATKTFDLSNFFNVIHLSHEDIEKDLGDKSWIIPRGTSAVCSYGFYKAYKMGFDVTIKIDDDLLVREEGFVEKHIENLFTPRPLYWMNVFSNNRVYPRGFPFKERMYPSVLNYGLADNILDLDAPTQILGQNSKISQESLSAPYGCHLPLCGMNVAFLTEITPAYYFGLQGEKWGVDRYDDIWAGVFLKKITDHLEYVISVGQPVVTHNKLSNPLVNLKKESGGMDINEMLWEKVNLKTLKTRSFKSCFIEIADSIDDDMGEYGRSLKRAMIAWANLY